MKEQTSVQSDREFLERFGDKWFRAAIGKLDRIEDQWEKETKFHVHEMPDWVGLLMGKLFDMLGVKPLRPEMMNEEQFGKLLGTKVLITSGLHYFFKNYDATDDASRGKLTKMLGGTKAVEHLRAQEHLFKRVDRLRKSVLARVGRLSLSEQGRFYRGYGNGLLFSETAKNWSRKENTRAHSSGYIRAFAVLHWKRIEELRTTGGWSELKQEFTRSLPDGVEISEDAFAKELQRAGVGKFGKIGAPKKLGQQSSSLS